MNIQHNISSADLVRNPAKKQKRCKSMNYKIFNSILTLPPKNFPRFRPLSPPPASESTMPTLCGGPHPAHHPAKKQNHCKSNSYKKFNSILTLPPKFFQPKMTHFPTISGDDHMGVPHEKKSGNDSS